MPVSADITFAISQEDGKFKGKCLNLSHSGMQFETREKLKKGMLLEVTIDTKSRKFSPMTVSAAILRVTQSKQKTFIISCRILEYR